MIKRCFVKYDKVEMKFYTKRHSQHDIHYVSFEMMYGKDVMLNVAGLKLNSMQKGIPNMRYVLK